MVDLTRRKSLKAIGGAAAVAAATPAVSIACQKLMKDSTEGHASNNEVAVPLSGYVELTAKLVTGTDTSIKLSNNSEQPIVLKHVHPGIVHAGTETFDINSILANGPLTIAAGTSISLRLTATHATQAETVFPRHLYQSKPQRVIAVNGVNSYGAFVNSSRSFYS